MKRTSSQDKYTANKPADTSQEASRSPQFKVSTDYYKTVDGAKDGVNLQTSGYRSNSINQLNPLSKKTDNDDVYTTIGLPDKYNSHVPKRRPRDIHGDTTLFNDDASMTQASAVKDKYYYMYKDDTYGSYGGTAEKIQKPFHINVE